ARACAPAGPLPVAPVVDGDLLTAHPVDAVRTGTTAPVPLLVTTTAEETRLFTAIGQDGLDTDQIFGAPARELVTAHRGPAEHRICEHRSPMSHGGVALGACHLVDVPLYFGTHGTPLTGSGPHVDTLAQSMSTEFARFCRGGEGEE
ncbi:MAG: carboxylesterase family protein, partial [Nonomuraea sp.]|nr:carboxylesterase family protein [Nonomuraea sp.]